MRVIKTIRQGLLHKTYYQGGAFHFSVGALSFFPLDAPRNLGTEPEMWTLISQELHKEAIFDMAMPKANGEVLVYGKCCAKRGSTVKKQYVDIQIDSVKRSLMVSGNRCWKPGFDMISGGWDISEPESFEQISIGWKNAFGGEGYDHNPWGKGYINNTPTEYPPVPLPNVESPSELVLRPGDKPMPGGFGAIEIMWPSRIKKAGTYSNSWLKNEFPGLPKDADWSIYNTAHSLQQKRGFWKGTEEFVVSNMHPDNQRICGKLPGIRSRCFYHLRDNEGVLQWNELPLHCETVWLFPTAGWGIVLSRGTVEIDTFLGRDVETLLLAYEFQGEKSRSAEEYLSSVHRRDDEEISMFWLGREDDLRPPGLPLLPDELAELAAQQEQEAETGKDEISAETKRVSEGMGLREMLPLRATAQEREEKEAIEKAKKEAEAFDVSLLPASQMTQEEETDALKLPTAADDEHCQAAMMNFLQQHYAYGEELFSTVLSEDEADIVGFLALADQTEEAARKMCAMYGIDMDARARESEKAFFDIEDEYFDMAMEEYSAEHFSYDENTPFYMPLTMIDDDLVIALAIVKREEAKVSQFAEENDIDLDKAKEEAKKNEKQAIADLAAPLKKMRENLKDHPDALKKLDAAIVDVEQIQPQMDKVLAQIEKEDAAPGELKLDRRVVELMYKKNESLAGLDLTGVDLSNLHLVGANFERAIMADANFKGANLTKVNFTEAVLDNANFSTAKCEAANFSSAQMTLVDAQDGVFSKAIFENTSIDECDFARADFSEVDFSTDMTSKTSFQSATFRGAVISKAAVYECNFSYANFHRANCSGMDFNECILDKADFTQANLQEVSFVGVKGRECIFCNALMKDANMHLETDFTGANFYQANCEGASFGESVLNATDFRETILNDADFSACNLCKALFDKAVAREALFVDANMQDTSLSGVDLLKASIEGAKLNRANITNAQLFDTQAMFADLTDSIMFDTKLERTLFRKK